MVVTGRVTDASLVVGAGVAEFGWDPTSYDELAGAVVAGHVLECGAQATGGNFSGFRSLPHTGQPLGFPIAELAADGSSVITKHDGTGGAVTVDTVTAQLLYEIQSTRYLGPDVTTLLDTIRLEQEGPDRVAVTGVRGEAPPARLKVCVNELGGHRNTVEFVLTGLDVDAKADWVREQMVAAFAASGVGRLASVTWSRTSVPHPDADTEEAASCLLRCAVKDPSAEPVGKPFTAAAVELALASYPGFTLTCPPAPPTPVRRLPPGLRRPLGRHPHRRPRRRLARGGPRPDRRLDGQPATGEGKRPSPFPAPTDVVTRRLPLGHVRPRPLGRQGRRREPRAVGHPRRARTSTTPGSTWLSKLISPERVRELVPEAEDLDIEVYVLPNLGAVNVLIHGLLGEGVAASTRFDPQAKGLGEWVRSRMVAIEESLLYDRSRDRRGQR